MSATMRRLEWSIVVEDYERWRASSYIRCEQDGATSYDDWVIRQIEIVMENAGNEFIRQHPDLFRTQELT